MRSIKRITSLLIAGILLLSNGGGNYQLLASGKSINNTETKQSLSYVEDELIVIFDKNTSKQEIKTVCEHVADSYEIILDNNFVMDESLSEERKERLKALEKYKGNIVVVVNLDSDKNLNSAMKEFKAYECVVEVDVNEILSTSDINIGTTGITDPEAPTNLKAAKTASKTAKITWKKSNAADGYEIYLKKGNEKYKKVKTISSAKKTSYQIKNLSNKNTYKVKMRSYIKVDGKKFYSSYTKPVTLNMKKAIFPESIFVVKNIELKVGETKRLPMKCPLDDNKKSLMKSVKCTVKNKKIASAKERKITGKKAGATTIQVKVTARNGATKTFTTRIKVKNK